MLRGDQSSIVIAGQCPLRFPDLMAMRNPFGDDVVFIYEQLQTFIKLPKDIKHLARNIMVIAREVKEDKGLPPCMPHIALSCYGAIGDVPGCRITPLMFQYLHFFEENWNELEPFLVGKKTAGVVIYAVTQHPTAPEVRHIAGGLALFEADEP